MSTNPDSQHRKQRNLTSQGVNQISPSGIRRFFDLLASMEDVISLGVGEPDFTTPWHICEAAIHSLEKGYTMYTSNSGMPELRHELSRYLKNNYDLEYDPDSELLITVGVSEALDLAMRAILDPGDEVIMPDPCYVSYNPCVTLARGIPVMVPTNQENNFEISAADIEKRVTSRTKAILIGYPANPTGAVMTRDKLAQVAEVAQRHQRRVTRILVRREIVRNDVQRSERTLRAQRCGQEGLDVSCPRLRRGLQVVVDLSLKDASREVLGNHDDDCAGSQQECDQDDEELDPDSHLLASPGSPSTISYRGSLPSPRRRALICFFRSIIFISRPTAIRLNPSSSSCLFLSCCSARR